MNNSNENWVRERVEVTKPMSSVEPSAIGGIKKSVVRHDDMVELMVCMKYSSQIQYLTPKPLWEECFLGASLFYVASIFTISDTWLVCATFFLRLHSSDVCVSVYNWIFENIIRRLPFGKRHTHTHTPPLALFFALENARNVVLLSRTLPLSPHRSHAKHFFHFISFKIKSKHKRATVRRFYVRPSPDWYEISNHRRKFNFFSSATQNTYFRAL